MNYVRAQAQKSRPVAEAACSLQPGVLSIRRLCLGDRRIDRCPLRRQRLAFGLSRLARLLGRGLCLRQGSPCRHGLAPHPLGIGKSRLRGGGVRLPRSRNARRRFRAATWRGVGLSSLAAENRPRPNPTPIRTMSARSRAAAGSHSGALSCASVTAVASALASAASTVATPSANHEKPATGIVGR